MGDGESVLLFLDAPRHPHQPHHYDSRPTSMDSNTHVGRVAPPTQSRDDMIKLKTEKRVERLLTPTVYRLPGSLPPAPTPAREPGTVPMQLSSDDSGDMSDDDKPLTEGQQAEIACQNQVFQESRPGPIPEELGVVLVNQNYECNNFFRGAVSCHFYLLAQTNTIYSGVTAVMAAEAEEEGRDFVTPSNRRLYTVVCRGFPMNPREVRQLYKLCMDRRAHTMDCVEGFHLLNEFQKVTGRHHPALWDLSMKTVMDTSIIPKDIPIPYNSRHDAWNHPPIPRTINGVFEGRHDKPPGVGLLAPGNAQAFNIDAWARYITYHGRPGHQSCYPGVVMDYGLWVYRPSLFGCLLGRALSPPDQFRRHTFQRLFACLVAQPGLYAERVEQWNTDHPDNPFRPATGGHVTITRLSMDSDHVANMTIDNVMATLRDNRIPVAWVNHSYAYGLRYLSKQFTGEGRHIGLMEDTDDEHIPRLGLHSRPPTIPDWDSWWMPSPEDLNHIHLLMANEERMDFYCMEDSPDWMPVGGNPFPLFI
jgi:hypothetical protein